MALLRTDVSEEHSAFFIRVTRIGEQGTTLMKEALSSSETSVLTRATRRKIPKDTILHSHRRENVKSYKGSICFTDQELECYQFPEENRIRNEGNVSSVDVTGKGQATNIIKGCKSVLDAFQVVHLSRRNGVRNRRAYSNLSLTRVKYNSYKHLRARKENATQGTTPNFKHSLVHHQHIWIFVADPSFPRRLSNKPRDP
jgi:hypothetical protein